MKTSEIADRFLNYFEKRGHLVKPSASLVSSNPTTLFTIAGMIPFIPYLLGEQKPESKRMASLQKCVRTLDIDEVGKTTRHGTFFQMLGNFSFGDYFKKEAIGWAWDLLTGDVEEGGYGLDPERLFVTVFEEDAESEEIWRSLGVEGSHIQKLGMEDNFWTTGGPGPGGPCSEIFLDQGEEFGEATGPSGNDRRYIEIWDLVFENYEVDNVRSKTDLHIAGELKNKNIDTGMGLERLSYLLNGKKNIYETDEVFPVIEATEILSGRKYGSDPFCDTHMRIVADHVRSAMMIMADGVEPSNLARGYVLRRLLRRSVRSLTLLGAPQRALLPELLGVSEKAMREEYPELEEKISSIQAEAEKEEETFRRTLNRGSDMLSSAISRAKAEKKEKIDGKDAFQLHDTFGFPIELTREIARESGLEVDEEGFKAQMAIQKGRARQDAVNKRHNVDVAVYDEAKKRLKGEQKFTGYQTLSSSGTILEILSEKGPAQKACEGEMVDLILDSSSFYFEKGGQLADRGEIVSPTGVCEVLDVQQPVKGLTVHHCRVEEGEVRSGQKVQTLVDSERRAGLARSHTATHILHRAIREVMGPDAVQCGSVVDVDALSFDYKSGRAPTKEELFAIEQMVNMKIMEDLPVSAEEMPLEKAIEQGAMHLFSDKYSPIVRVVSIGEDGWSRELCGGTHLPSTGRAGQFVIVSEFSNGAGIRRIDALVGKKAYLQNHLNHRTVKALSSAMGCLPQELETRASSLLSNLKSAEKELSGFREEKVEEKVKALAASGKSAFVEDLGKDVTIDLLRKAATSLMSKIQNRPACCFFYGVSVSAPIVVAAANRQAVAKGVKANELVKAFCTAIKGGGGGSASFAQGGGKAGQKTGDGVKAVREKLEALKA